MKSFFLSLACAMAAALGVGAAEFDSTAELSGAPWAPESSGYVDGARDIVCRDGILSFVLTAAHTFMEIPLTETAAVGERHLLRFRLHAPVDGRVTIYYIATDDTMAMMDQIVEVEAGWQEYEIDLNEQSFGAEFHRGGDAGQAYARFGGATGAVRSMRIDCWFPVDSQVEFDYLRLDAADE